MAEEEINDVTLELPQEHREASATGWGPPPENNVIGSEGRTENQPPEVRDRYSITLASFKESGTIPEVNDKLKIFLKYVLMDD